MPLVVFLHGPIGSGKTTLGRALAKRWGVPFLDGDDFGDRDRPWLRSVLRRNRALAAAALAALEQFQVVVIGYPLRPRDWRFHRLRLGGAGVETRFVGLIAAVEVLDDPARGRMLDAAERERAVEMLEQGYGARPFSHLLLDTGACSVAAAVETIETAVRGLPSRPIRARSRADDPGSTPQAAN